MRVSRFLLTCAMLVAGIAVAAPAPPPGPPGHPAPPAPPAGPGRGPGPGPGHGPGPAPGPGNGYPPPPPPVPEPIRSPRPSGSPRPNPPHPHKRQLVPTLPLGTLNDFARCPPDHLACPVENMSFESAMQLPVDADYECIDPKQELYSCGGCSTMGTGMDCTAIPNVLSVECAYGACNVLACETGFVLARNGRSCVRA